MRQNLLCGVLCAATLFFSASLNAQLSVTALSTDFTIDFDNTVAGVNDSQIDGSGFAVAPASGDLDADAWATTGFSDGAKAFGVANTSGDHARGTSTGGVTTGGCYAFEVASGDHALGAQGTGGDWTPGTIALQIDNTTGSIVTDVDIDYEIWEFNDQGRGNTFNFEWSTDGSSWNPEATLDFSSTTAAAGAPAWISAARTITLTGLTINSGSPLFIRWTSNDDTGSGSRDELGVDDIVINMQGSGAATTTVDFVTAANAVAEGDGTYDLTLSISNESATVATSVDVVLNSGVAARINSYVTQTVTWTAGDATDKTLTVTITDNGICDGGDVHVFNLSNAVGGTSAAVGTNDTFTSALSDNDGVTNSFSDDFESGAITGWTQGVSGDWIASATTPINGTFSLKHNLSGVAGSSSISTPFAASLDDGDNTWRLQFENGAWDPSGGNKFWFWLAANESDVSSGTVDGYVVGVNATGTSDFLSVWRVDNGAATTAIVTSSLNWGTSDLAGIEVTRSSGGTWELLFDADGDFDALVSAGTGVESTYNTMSDMGAEFVFTSTRAGLLWVDDVSYVQSACIEVYYSQGSGNETDAIWDIVPVGTGGVVAFSPFKTMIVQAGHSVTQTGATVAVRDLQVDAAGTLDLGTNSITAYGTAVTLNGTVDGQGSLVIANTGAVALSGASDVVLENLTSNSSTCTVSLTSLSVSGELSLNAGNFNASASDVILVSSVTATARLAELGAGVSYTGDITMERFVPGGVTSWRSIGSAVAGQTLSDLDDDFFTAGFTGSNYPNFHVDNDPMLPLWPSIRSYDESDAGAALLDGLVGPTNITDAIGVGQGYAAWAGDTYVSTAAFVIDMTGAPNTGTIALPMTYTSSGAPLIDGWNLVANPLPSPIDFGLVSLGADVDNNYYVYDPISGNNAAWNEALGISIPSGSLNGNIQSSQGFWLHATGAAFATSVGEAAKVNEPIAGGLFGGSQVQNLEMARLKISSGINSYFDETVLVFEGGSDNFDSNDMMKFIFDNGASPQIASESSDGVTTTLNDWGTFTNDISIAVQVQVPITGTYTFTMFDAESILGLTCFVLEDLVTGSMTTMSEGATYDFVIDQNDPASPARFVLHAAAPAAHYKTDVLCAGDASGSATIVNPTMANWTLDWMDDAGLVFQTQNISNGAAIVNNLVAGDYSVSIAGGCGNLVKEFRIDEPSMMGVSSVVNDATCAIATDASVDITPQGGIAPLSFLWSNNSTDEDLVNVGAGSYDLLITDATGCEFAMPSVVVAAGNGPSATATASSTSVLVGEEIEFYGLASVGSLLNWDMGDGTFYNVDEPLHTYSMPGIYNVSFTADINGCETISVLDIDVSVSTSVAEVSASDFEAYMNGGDVFLSWNKAGMNAQVMDITGRIVKDNIVMNGSTGNTTVSLRGESVGLYFLIVKDGENSQTVRLPYTR